MIGTLQGTILQRRPPWLWLDVQGVGYEVEMPLSSFYDMAADGSPLRLFTHLAIREDAHLLYGFLHAADRDLFRQLIRVNGIGGKVALACLSGLEEGQLRQALMDGNTRVLTAIPGIGAKTAERMVVELRDKLGNASPDSGGPSLAGDPRQEAIAALLSLGYRQAEASQAIARLDGGLAVEEMIRQGLQSLARR